MYFIVTEVLLLAAYQSVYFRFQQTNHTQVLLANHRARSLFGNQSVEGMTHIGHAHEAHGKSASAY